MATFALRYVTITHHDILTGKESTVPEQKFSLKTWDQIGMGCVDTVKGCTAIQ